MEEQSTLFNWHRGPLECGTSSSLQPCGPFFLSASLALSSVSRCPSSRHLCGLSLFPDCFPSYLCCRDPGPVLQSFQDSVVESECWQLSPHHMFSLLFHNHCIDVISPTQEETSRELRSGHIHLHIDSLRIPHRTCHPEGAH